MKSINNIKELKESLALVRAQGKRVGLVPTMGALHEGHLSLIRMARADNDVVVVSLFVNPIQFDSKDDYNTYPRDLDRDKETACREGVEFLFVPTEEEMYPEGFSAYVEVANVSERLCGAYRPGHFSGVATVVTKLFNVIKPNRAYFGQKDFQQTVLIKKLVKDLNMDVEVVVLPTVREADGLAISSRNRLLTPGERQVASAIHRALLKANDLFARGLLDSQKLIQEMHDILHKAGIFRIDYVAIVDPETLEELPEAKVGAVATLAVWVGKVRLIDNMAFARIAIPKSKVKKLEVNV